MPELIAAVITHGVIPDIPFRTQVASYMISIVGSLVMFSIQLIVYSWNTWHWESLGWTVLPAPLITFLCSALVMCSTLTRLEIHWLSFLLSMIQKEFGSSTYIAITIHDCIFYLRPPVHCHLVTIYLLKIK